MIRILSLSNRFISKTCFEPVCVVLVSTAEKEQGVCVFHVSIVSLQLTQVSAQFHHTAGSCVNFLFTYLWTWCHSLCCDTDWICKLFVSVFLSVRVSVHLERLSVRSVCQKLHQASHTHPPFVCEAAGTLLCEANVDMNQDSCRRLQGKSPQMVEGEKLQSAVWLLKNRRRRRRRRRTGSERWHHVTVCLEQSHCVAVCLVQTFSLLAVKQQRVLQSWRRRLVYPV